MFRLFPRRTGDHVVFQGNVGCPQKRRDVELDTCLACEWLDDVTSARSARVVRCRSDQRRFDAALYAF